MSGPRVGAFLERVMGGCDLPEADAEVALRELATGTVEPALAGAFLVALRLKGESPGEIRGFARGMRALAIRPELGADVLGRAVDVVGTGGDGSGSFNLSTGSAILAAAAGVPVIKHGNRSISSRSGSADVLGRLGVPVPLEPDAAARCLRETGFTFLFAPRYHPAMTHLAGVRRALGVRTVFNLLGPLTNPAAPAFHVVGAWSEEVAERMAGCLSGLPIARAFVLHGTPGWDEATPCGSFTLFDVRPGVVERGRRDPAELGLPRCAPEELRGGDAGHNARGLRAALTGTPGPHADALVLGASLALEVTGAAVDRHEAAAMARRAIEDGSAGRTLGRIARFGRTEAVRGGETAGVRQTAGGARG